MQRSSKTMHNDVLLKSHSNTLSTMTSIHNATQPSSIVLAPALHLPSGGNLANTLDQFDFSSYSAAQLEALANELEGKNEYLKLENSIFESFFNRSNSGPPSSNTAGGGGATVKSATPGANSSKLAKVTEEGKTDGRGAPTPAPTRPSDDLTQRATSLAAGQQAAGGGAAGNATKRKKGDKSKQATDVLVQLTAEQKAEIATRELEELRDELERRRGEWSRIVDNQRAELEEIDIGLAELKKDQYEFRRDIVHGALNERTGKVMAEKVVRYWEDRMRARDTTLEKIRLKNATLKTHKNKLMLQLRQKEEMGEVLHAIDFDQLKIENHQYLAKIEERNTELLKLKLVAGNIVQVMNVYKRKLLGLEEESSRLRAELKARKELLERLRVEGEQVKKDVAKAVKVNKALVTAGKEYSVPSVMEYVMLKAEQEEIYTKVRSWRRKVEIAQMSALRPNRQSSSSPIHRSNSGTITLSVPPPPGHKHSSSSRRGTPKPTATEVLVQSQTKAGKRAPAVVDMIAGPSNSRSDPAQQKTMTVTAV
ncbi:hypothetical protein BCR44DRAFT_1011504 [Catenaria anguillulae PL171]|uniref:Cilia- and flagella-associated protein 263 n=1 Tax=Catenaria anguillulae PL171 TaxID=765915 RepID=A0A1Y2I4J7_9FUNG|nr:hypothetical protein BCR44DRAFT_1011504 [Catenaria anguillulae PL171]